MQIDTRLTLLRHRVNRTSFQRLKLLSNTMMNCFQVLTSN